MSLLTKFVNNLRDHRFENLLLAKSTSTIEHFAAKTTHVRQHK
jgi:hypothetical protein